MPGLPGLPFFRRSRQPNLSSPDKKQIDHLLAEIEQLKTANEQLKEQLAARSVHLGEYLYKWRAVALPLLGSEWELRYWVLSGTTLSYYTSARDIGFSPREEISVMSCYVAWEGLRGGRFWAFSVLDSGGSVLARMAAPARPNAERWLAALEAAGCVRDDGLVPAAGPKGAAREGAKRPSIGQLMRSMSAPAPRSVAAAADGVAAAAAATADGGKAKAKAATVAAASRKGKATAAESDADATAAPAGPLDAPAAAAAGGRLPESHSEPAPGKRGADGTTRPPTSNGGGPDSAPLSSRRSLGARPGRGPERGPMLGSTPVHTAGRFSLLSSERVWHEKHTGLYNLTLIILVLTNFRLALENALKYGWRLNPVRLLGDAVAGRRGGGSGLAVNVPLVACYPLLLAAVGLSLGAELAGYALLQQELRLRESLSKRDDVKEGAARRALRSREQATEWGLFLANTATTTCVLGLPWYIISATKAEPISGSILMFLAVVLWMKLVSYHHCCFDLRMARRCGEIRPGERGSGDTPAQDWGPLARYPENLTLGNLMYFLALPTLTYQVNYPLARSIRWRWLLRRLFELAITLTALAIIIGQYVEPTVANSIGPLQKMDYLRVVERVLKLALPSTYAWLLCFYALFHLWLNVLAELTRFGDREFYKDWWNAPTLGEYWKLWNMPVHKWLLRHVYFPAVRAGLSRFWAVIATFFVSAVFHELLLGVPLHMVRLWAFLGIMFQVPLIMVTEQLRKKLQRDELGNYIFWISFCIVGQPVSVLLYYHDYCVVTRPALEAVRMMAAAAGGGVLGGGMAAGTAAAAAAATLNGTTGALLANGTSVLLG